MEKSNRKTVLILTNMYPDNNNPNFGIFIHEQIKYIKNNSKYDFVVLSPRPFAPFPFNLLKSKWATYSKVKANDSIEGIPVYYPKYLYLPGKHFFAFSVFSTLICSFWVVKRVFKSYRPSIIHAHAATPAGFLGLLLKHIFKLPLICSLIGSDINAYPYYDSLSALATRRTLSDADYVISISHDLEAKARIISGRKENISTIYIGVDTNTFQNNKASRDTLRNGFKVGPKDKILLFVGHLIKTKGIYELIEAFRSISELFSNAFLLVAGIGIEENALKRLVTTYKLENRVLFLGNQNHKQIPGLLSSSDIFVLPSYNEGLCISIIEAISCNKPVIATNVGAIPELIESGINGILVKKEDAESLAEGIKYLLSNENEWMVMGANGREKALRLFSEEESKNRTTEVYAHVLASGGPGR